MCVMPITIKKYGNSIVPCGRCTECRARRISAWSFRLLQESKIHTSSHFITLTYATKHVNLTENAFMSLHKRDLQNFFKRLRRATRKATGNTIKYYAAGEYGGITNRPHYHAIVFGSQPAQIGACWRLGQIHYGNVSGASIGYCLKYISKQSSVKKHKNDYRQKEFAIMSKGLGKNYLDPERGFREWHKNNLEDRMYLNIPDGKKASMPRYYKDKLYTTEEREIIAARHIRRASEKAEQILDNGVVHNDRSVILAQEKLIIQTPYKDKL